MDASSSDPGGGELCCCRCCSSLWCCCTHLLAASSSGIGWDLMPSSRPAAAACSHEVPVLVPFLWLLACSGAHQAVEVVMSCSKRAAAASSTVSGTQLLAASTRQHS